MTWSMYSSKPKRPSASGMSRALCQSVRYTSWSASIVRTVSRNSVAKCPDERARPTAPAARVRRLLGEVQQGAEGGRRCHLLVHRDRRPLDHDGVDAERGSLVGEASSRSTSYAAERCRTPTVSANDGGSARSARADMPARVRMVREVSLRLIGVVQHAFTLVVGGVGRGRRDHNAVQRGIGADAKEREHVFRDIEDQQSELRRVVSARLAAVQARRPRCRRRGASGWRSVESAELLLLAPSFLVPRLTHGDVEVWDTMAIAEYLHELLPEAELFPSGTAARAQCRSICGEMHSGFANLRSALPMNLKSSHPGFRIWSGAEADIDRIAEIWRECLACSGGPYLFGARPGAVDAMFAPVCAAVCVVRCRASTTSAPRIETACWHCP